MSFDAALEKHRKTAKPGHLLFARESVGGRRTYSSMLPHKAWEQTTASKRAHLYEVLTGPCSFYLDIEWFHDTKPSDEKARVCGIADQVKSVLARAYECEPTYTTVTASGKTAKGYKCSWHVHYHTAGIAWNSAADVGDFVKEHFANIPEIDLAPYKSPTQNWRCVGSSKADDPDRVLGPSTKDTFLACIVHSNAAVIVSRKQALCTRTVSLPESMMRIAGMFEGTRMEAVQMAHNADRYLVLPCVSKMCAIAGRKHSSNHPYVVVDTMCMRWRHACHNESCSASPQPWQAMAQFDTCKKMLPPSSPVCMPILCNDEPQLTVRSRGPPPVSVFSNEVRVVRCCNGTFRLPHAI